MGKGTIVANYEKGSYAVELKPDTEGLMAEIAVLNEKVLQVMELIAREQQAIEDEMIVPEEIDPDETTDPPFEDDDFPPDPMPPGIVTQTGTTA